MRKYKPLLLTSAYLCIIGVFLSLTVLGYRYLVHRNRLMENAIVSSARMNLKMKIIEIEQQIIGWEHKVISEYLARPGNGTPPLIDVAPALMEKYPLLASLTVVTQDDLGRIMPVPAQRQLEAAIQGGPRHAFELYHFSAIKNGQPRQIGYMLLPSADSLYYLVLSLNIDYFKTTFLDQALAEIAGDRKFRSVAIAFSGQPNDNHAADPEQTVVETSFASLFSFWRVVAEVDMSGVKSRARIEAIAFSGITLITVLVIGISIFFIAIYIQQEKNTSKIKSEMVSTVSHELKTPVALIRMYTETLLMDRIRESAKKSNYYHIIIEACDRLNLIINNILDFSQIEKGIKKYHFSKHSFQQTVQQLLETYSHYIRHQGFMFNFSIAHELPPFCFDKVAITQALGNLLDNAMKFSGTEKRIDVRLGREDGFAVVTVADRGIGMDRETIGSIFKPYFRAQPAFRGTGIGLSLVKHAIDAHNGSITVESKIGAGSVFTIRLPILEDRHDP